MHSAAVGKILKRMHALSGNARRPRRKPDIALYSSKFYASKLKGGFDEMWDGVKDTFPGSARISMCQDYVKTCWAREPEDLKLEIKEESDKVHKAAMEEYTKLHSVPEGSAEEYHQ